MPAGFLSTQRLLRQAAVPFTELVGNGSDTDFTVTPSNPSIDTSNVVVSVTKSADGKVILPKEIITGVNGNTAVTVQFESVPAVNEFIVSIIGKRM